MEIKINKLYILDYLKAQYQYFDKKSITLKKWYSFLIILEAIISTFIPFTTLFIDKWSDTRYIVAFMGSIVAIISIFISRFGFHEKWIAYRIIAENLKIEQVRFESESSPYDSENKWQLLLEKVTDIVKQVNYDWREIEENIKHQPPQNQ